VLGVRLVFGLRTRRVNFRIILDENVSLRVVDSLKSLGYEVLVIAKLPKRGMSDAEVFALAQEKPSLLITRDAHFTNSLRFPPPHELKASFTSLMGIF